MIHRDLYDQRMRQLAIACLILAVCILTVLLWGPQ
jgi:hypothetical protein